MSRARRVYVAGPYTKGDVAVNVRTATLMAAEIFDAGMVPYLPHLTHFWHTIAPRPYEDWMRLDMEWLKCCDAVLRLPGESSGADREVAAAKDLGIPVWHTMDDLLYWRVTVPA